MKDLGSLVRLLTNILVDTSQRKESIKRFQQLVWESSEPIATEWVWETFTELAYDLDFYEQDPMIRKEDPSYYGEEILTEKVRATLAKLKQNGISVDIDL